MRNPLPRTDDKTMYGFQIIVMITRSQLVEAVGRPASNQAEERSFDFNMMKKSVQARWLHIDDATQIVFSLLRQQRMLILSCYLMASGHSGQHKGQDTFRKSFYCHVWLLGPFMSCKSAQDVSGPCWSITTGWTCNSSQQVGLSNSMQWIMPSFFQKLHNIVRTSSLRHIAILNYQRRLQHQKQKQRTMWASWWVIGSCRWSYHCIFLPTTDYKL